MESLDHATQSMKILFLVKALQKYFVRSILSWAVSFSLLPQAFAQPANSNAPTPTPTPTPAASPAARAQARPAKGAAPAPAAPATTPTPGGAPKKVEGQWATVKTDNALVYDQPDFDAPTLMYLPAGQKIRISNKSFGSYFKFYRVKVSQTKIGYITTIDVIPQKPGPPEKGMARGKGKRGKKQASGKPTTGKYPPVKAFIQTKYMGFWIGNLNYKETIPGINPTATMLFYGVKLTGPHTLMTLPTDFNLLIHYGAPPYYSQFSTVKPAGFAMIVDWLAMFPFLDKQNSSFYIGLGPLLDYSSFQFGTTAGVVSSSELSIGLSAEIGYGIKLGTNWCTRIEYKYMWERANYTSYGLAVQNRF